MKGERGVALRILYQLKMSLEKVYPPTDISVLRKSNYLNINLVIVCSWKDGRQLASFENSTIKREIRSAWTTVFPTKTLGFEPPTEGIEHGEALAEV
jgi:hypothetical protein